MSFTAADHAFMARALQLAACGLFTTTPNPRVGCVLVKDGHIIGEGWHQKAGEPHAEIHALQNIGAGGTATDPQEMARGATAYVTLEPCSHHGRTPPCADRLIKAGVARVVAAMRDPNPLVAGQGLARLANAGITTDSGLLEAEARELNIGFISRMTRGRPWVRLKIASSLDGKTALANGASQWITGPDARRDGHGWRARSCAVLTGIGTVKDDNPRLDVRDVATTRQPRPVVVDSRLEIAADAKLLARQPLIYTASRDTARMTELAVRGAEVIVLPNASGKVDLGKMLFDLGSRGINELLVEAGTKLNGSLLRERCVDELLLYQAPMLLGDQARGLADLGLLTQLANARQLNVIERRVIGADFFTRARFS